MREDSSPPLQQRYQPLSEFLPALFRAFGEEGIEFCVLRNYEGFPSDNVGNDIDLLIRPAQRKRALNVLQSLQGIRAVNYTDMNVFASVYLEGAFATAGSRSLQVDLFWSLASKGPEYLSADAVLKAAHRRSCGGLGFLVPSPAHEAIVSLCANLVYGGTLKEKYFPRIQRTFVDHRLEVISALQLSFGIKAALQLADAIVEGDRGKILECAQPLRFALNLRSFLRDPLHWAVANARYYASIFRLRYSRKNVETVSILGPESSAEAVIEALVPMLHSVAKVVERRQFRASEHFERKVPKPGATSDSQLPGSSNSLASMATAAMLLGQEWRSQFFGRRELTLRIVSECGWALGIDPNLYGYSRPGWFARILGRLFPCPDLSILLAPLEDGAAWKMMRKCEFHSSSVNTPSACVLLDARHPVSELTEQAYAAIIAMLSARTEIALGTAL